MNIANLKEHANKLKEDLSKNVINIDKINMILDSILNDDDVKKPSEIPSSDNKPLTANDIVTLFKSFLQTKCDEKGNLIKTWSESEELSSPELEDILKYANEIKSDTFEDAASEYIADDYINILESLSDKLIAEFYDAIGLKEKDISNIPHFGKHLLEDCINDLNLNVNAKQLLKQSSIDDLTICFASEHDIMPNFIHILNDHKFLTDRPYTALDWLLELQGYTRADLKSVSKRNNSIFLKSLYTEISNCHDYMWCHLIAVPNTTDFESLFKLSRNEEVILKKSTRFGLFNSVTGDTCGINITLEQDIIIDINAPICDVRLIYNHPKSDTIYEADYYSPSVVTPNLRDTKNEDLESYNNYLNRKADEKIDNILS